MMLSRTLVASLMLPISALAQTPASDVNVNTNTPDVSGLFVEVVSEMESPTPQEAIGAPGDLAEPNTSSVLPMPGIAPQSTTTTSTTTTAGSVTNPSVQVIDPPQVSTTSVGENVTSLEGAEKAIVSLKQQNAELQERLNNLNKQMLLLRQSFQQANSALLQRINELQVAQGQKPTATPVVVSPAQNTTSDMITSIAPAPASTSAPTSTTITTIVPPQTPTSILAPAPATSITTTTAPTPAPVLAPAPDATITTTAPASTSSAPAPATTVTTVVPPQAPASTSATTTTTTTAMPAVPETAPVSTTTVIAPGAEAPQVPPADNVSTTQEEPLVSIAPTVAPVQTQTTEKPVETNATTPASETIGNTETIAESSISTQPSAPVEGNQPNENRSMGSPAWEATMEQQKQEEQRQLELQQEALRQQEQQQQEQQQETQPASTELSIAPAPSAEPTNVSTSKTTKTTSRLETLTQNTELDGGIKGKVTSLLNDPGFILKLGIGLAVLGLLWLISTLVPRSKRSKKEEYDEEDIYENESENDEENMPSFETDSSEWGKGDLGLNESSLDEPSEEKEFDQETDEKTESEYSYDHSAAEHEHIDEAQENESFSIADEELEEEDMLPEESEEELEEEPRETETSTQEYDFSEQVEDSENVSIKLDLARAYLEMRDFATAEEVLNTILDQGTPSQQQEAKNLMDELKSAQGE